MGNAFCKYALRMTPEHCSIFQRVDTRRRALFALQLMVIQLTLEKNRALFDFGTRRSALTGGDARNFHCR
jgi:hypothetical protein